MPIDENCVNTLEDIISDLRSYFRGLQHYSTYGKSFLEPITSELTPDDVADILNSFKYIKELSSDLELTIKECEK